MFIIVLLIGRIIYAGALLFLFISLSHENPFAILYIIPCLICIAPLALVFNFTFKLYKEMKKDDENVSTTGDLVYPVYFVKS